MRHHRQGSLVNLESDGTVDRLIRHVVLDERAVQVQEVGYDLGHVGADGALSLLFSFFYSNANFGINENETSWFIATRRRQEAGC